MKLRKMRQTIALQSDTGTISGGHPTSNWTTQETVRASVRTMTPKDKEAAGRDLSESLVEFCIHYPRSFTPTAAWRVVFNSNNYEIIADPENVDFMNREMLIIGKLVK